MPPEDDIDLELTYFDDALASFESGGAMSHHSTRLTRLAVLLTLEELGEMISLLRSVQGHADLSEVDASELSTLLDPMPQKLPKSLQAKQKEAQAKTMHSTPNNGKENSDNSAIGAMIAKRQVLSNRLSTAVNNAVRRSSSVAASTPSTPGSDEAVPTASDLGMGVSPVQANASVASVQSSSDSNVSGANGDSFDESLLLQQCEPDIVMVVPFPDRHTGEHPGFLSEEHVLSR